jgi:predicted nucleic acid-binding Zn ribbon protein
MSHCASCGRTIPKDTITCETCGRLLAGKRQVAVEPMRQEALVAFGLLRSAGFHPVIAFLDESGEPHPIDPEASFGHGAGLMIPVTTAFGIYVPEEEARESISVLEDARSSGVDAGQEQAEA